LGSSRRGLGYHGYHRDPDDAEITNYAADTGENEASATVTVV